jgi:PiT family inorganic phosphate transporter
MAGPVGLFVDGIITLAVVITIFQVSRRNKIGHHNVVSEVEGASEAISSPKSIRAAAKAAEAAKKSAERATKQASSKKKGGK